MLEAYKLRIYITPDVSGSVRHIDIRATKKTTSQDVVFRIARLLHLTDIDRYELAEVVGFAGQDCKIRSLQKEDIPASVFLLWPKEEVPDKNNPNPQQHRLSFREKPKESPTQISWLDFIDHGSMDKVISAFLNQPVNRENADLCNLPEITENLLMHNLRDRFNSGHIYTYVGSILIAVNPFQFFPIYNPKYVQLYQNRRLGELPPHIFAIADTAYHTMLRTKVNQCIVISGESGSGKTESTNFLLHHLTALTRKGGHASGVEQTILGAGPVLEAFGNAKTSHNNNSSRFGKFIQVNYRENGMVHGAVVEKYLLEKSRIVSQAQNERNYHVFYHLLAGASEEEKLALSLGKPEEFHYLNQSNCYTLEGVDDAYEFSRLRQSMELVGFTSVKQRRLFTVLAAVLHIGNINFKVKHKSSHHYQDEVVMVSNPAVVQVISNTLKVKEETLNTALTSKKTTARGETLVMNFNMSEAIATRDAVAKCLYGAIFDWIVLQLNHALMSKKDTLRGDHHRNSIGVLDIFGFEDFDKNNFEQFNINYANEQLQFYFNQHVFKFEQEEYIREGIKWSNISFIDNTLCLNLIGGKPTGLIALLDEECSFPGATNDTLLAKFNQQHKNNSYYEIPAKKESAFIIKHYAGSVKYQIKDFREKNKDLIRPDVVSVLKRSSLAFVRELIGTDPVAVFRWAVVRAYFRAFYAFRAAGKQYRESGRRGSLRRQKTLPKQPSVSDDANDIVRTVKVYSMLRAMASNRRNVPKYLSRLSSVRTPMISVSATVRNIEEQVNGGYPSEEENKVFAKANKIIMRNKSFKPRTRSNKGLIDIKSMKVVAGYGTYKSKKKSPTVCAQFQVSLTKLMETLNEANPFFVRCIRSNVEKAPCKFDNDIILRQLRYTGMLETVRIRRAGFNVRLTFEEFIQHYRILLPKGLLSSRRDVEDFLSNLNLNRDNYQLGSTKIFMRDAEKSKLDERLHREIIRRIITIQCWYRAHLQRREYVSMREAAVTLQKYVRRFLAQRRRVRLQAQLLAVVIVQKWWRRYIASRNYQLSRGAATMIQSAWRGYKARVVYTSPIPPDDYRYKEALVEEAKRRKQLEEEAAAARKLRIAELQLELENGEIKMGSPPGKPLEVELDLHDNRKEQPSPVDLTSITVEIDESKKRRSLPFRRNDEWRKLVRPKHPRSEDMELIPMPDFPEPPRPQFRYADTGISGRHMTMDLSSIIDQITPLEPSPTSSKGDHSQSDEGVLTHDSSRKTVLSDTLSPVKEYIPSRQKKRQDSEESSGITDDAEAELARIRKRIQQKMEKSRSLGRVHHHGDHSVSRTEDMSKKLLEDKNEQGTEQSADVSRRRNKVHKKSRSFSSQQSIIDQVTNREKAELVRRSYNEGRAATLGRSLSEQQDNTIMESLDGLNRKHHSSASQVEHALKSKADTDGKAGLKYSSPFSGVKKNIRRMLGGKKPDKSMKREFDDSEESPPEDLTSDFLLLKQRMDAGVNEAVNENVQSICTHSRKLTKIYRHETCSVCSKSISSFSGAYKCSSCKQVFHHKCIPSSAFSDPVPRSPDQQVSGTMTIPGSASPKAARKHRRLAKTLSLDPKSQISAPSEGRSVDSGMEFKDFMNRQIADKEELQHLSAFIFQKIIEMSTDRSRRDTIVDKVFKQALRAFHQNMVSSYSVIKGDNMLLRYRDLLSNFEATLDNICRKENTSANFPVSMGINAFRGFLDEFMSLYKTKEDRFETEVKVKKSVKFEKKKTRKKDGITEFNGHKFATVVMNIPTACEKCGAFMWLMEKGQVCQVCKLTCHKRCFDKHAIPCTAPQDSFGGSEKRVFGVNLDSLMARYDDNVPPFVESIITAIEIKGLYVEGLYRKSGAAAKIKLLKQAMDTDADDIDYDAYPIHVLSSTLKALFREMPEPVMTFELYDHFLGAIELTDNKERGQMIYDVIKKLPSTNFRLLERLMFHLARVAANESDNRMSPTNLAVVFTPCIFRPRQRQQAQDSITDINQQTECVEYIIAEQLKKYKITLAEIDTLESATASAQVRLSNLRSSKNFGPRSISSPLPEEMPEDEEEMLSEHISSLEHEKSLLAETLAALERGNRASSDDDQISDSRASSRSSLENLDDYEEYAITFDLPVSPPSQLRHLNKRRSPTMRRRPPSRPNPDDGKKLQRASSADTAAGAMPLVDSFIDDDSVMV